MIFAAVLALAGALSLPGGSRVAEGKGGATLLIGGADLAPYYHAFTDDSPTIGAIAETSAPPPDAAPAGASQLLAGAYDIYNDYVPQLLARVPSFRYVPASPDRPAYAVWQGEAERGLERGGWYPLPPDAGALFERARNTALSLKAARAGDLDTDPVAEIVRHGTFFDGQGRAGPPISDEYVANVGSIPGRETLATIAGDDARVMLDWYIASLHNFHQAPDPLGSQHYLVSTAGGLQIFFFQPATESERARVAPANVRYNGYFDADPTLERIVLRAVDHTAGSTGGDAGESPGSSSSKHIPASVLAALIGLAAFIVTAGGGFAWTRRRTRHA